MDRTDEDKRVPLDIDEARAEQVLAERLRDADRRYALHEVVRRSEEFRAARDRLGQAKARAHDLGASAAEIADASA